MPSIKELSYLYPEIEPHYQGLLKVSEIHSIFYEISGNPEGKPIIFLHGGPGGGVGPRDRRYFDPKVYRIILLEQRGCGRSIPHACIEENTTSDLVEDLEKLRKHLSVDKWIVFGGSWGSALGLAYAETYPSSVTGMVLRGIFTARKSEVEWIFEKHGAALLFPDDWEEFSSLVPVEERHNIIEAYYKRLIDPDPKVCQKFATAWCRWICDRCSFMVNATHDDWDIDGDWALSCARLEAHYFMNYGFRTGDELIKNTVKLRNIPAIMIQGRYDMVSPPVTAWEVHRNWPEAKLIMVHDAGHNSQDPGIEVELVRAMDAFRTL
ncbi:MAG: proline iminopeptidase [Piptocephalis tieghemiana]|nr:MAG: proline iminopeptidase [Piptocephalis tieghemiana]